MKPDVWVVWPTVHLEQSREMIDAWQALGYKVALLVNPPLSNMDFIKAEIVITQDEWLGFPAAANILCRTVPGNIVVVVGDDILPDPNSTAQQIGEQFLNRFPDTFGVMQPTGDEFGSYKDCAVSPWIGRKFIEEAYGGSGPYWEKYFHYFCDQELQEYAMKLGVFEQVSYLIQYHKHWQREERHERPGHLLKAKKKWHDDKRIFEERKLKGFK
jgi:hypothetical protein